MNISEVNKLYHQGRHNENNARLILVHAFISHLKVYDYHPDDAIYDKLHSNVDLIDTNLVSPSDKVFFASVKETVEMYQFYREGKTLQEIADWYGISRQAVQQRFERYGFNRHPSTTENASAARWASHD